MARAQPHPDYTVSDDTYELDRQGLKDKHWKTEIGDRRVTNKFVPRALFQRWDDGFVEFGVPGVLHGGGDSLSHDGDAIVWSRGIYTARFYDWTSDPDDGEGNGSFEWELVLAAVPPTNSFTLDLRTQNIQLYYQPALTAQDLADGAVRPERVVGSYAVYHTSKRWHKIGETDYEIGKIGHIYRPKVTDNLGDTIWGEWNTDAAVSGELTLTVDAAWLASAAYPVTIDPTFGYTTAGASTTGCGNGSLAWANDNATYQYTASAGDTVTLLEVYCSRAFGTCSGTAAVYDTSGGTANNQLVTGSFTPTAGGYAWEATGALSASMSGGTTYTVAWITTSNSNWNIGYDTGSAGDVSRDTVTTTFVLDDPWGDDASLDNLHSIKATYTEGGGASQRLMVLTS